MKKVLPCLLCLLLLASLLPLSALAVDSLECFVVNNPNPADRLHLRAKPDENATSLGKYYNGTQVELLEDVGNGWYKVSVGSYGMDGGMGIYGCYMKKQYLASGKAGDAVTNRMPRYVSTSSSWKLYSSIGIDGNGGYFLDKKLFNTYGNGIEVELMGFSNEWWHIRFADGSVTGFVPANSPQFKKPQTATVSNTNPSDRLNLRTSASKNAASIGKYYSGVKVTILGYAGDNRWAKVQIGSVTGYMDVNYLATNDAAQKKVKSACPVVQVKNPISTQHLNLRKLPSESAASLGRYTNGTSVTVLGIGPTWYHVEVDGINGFMMAKYLDPKLPQ